MPKKILNYLFNFNNQYFKDSLGITLIEILVSLSILALVSVAVIPNFKKSNSSSEFVRGSNDLKIALTKAQNGYKSGIKCGQNQSSVAWSVVVTPGNPAVYTLRCYYALQADLPTDAHIDLENPPRSLPSLINLSSPTCPGSTTLELRFDKNNLRYFCQSSTAFTPGNFKFNLSNSENTTQVKTLEISSLGLITEK